LWQTKLFNLSELMTDSRNANFEHIRAIAATVTLTAVALATAIIVAGAPLAFAISIWPPLLSALPLSSN